MGKPQKGTLHRWTCGFSPKTGGLFHLPMGDNGRNWKSTEGQFIDFKINTTWWFQLFSRLGMLGTHVLRLKITWLEKKLTLTIDDLNLKFDRICSHSLSPTYSTEWVILYAGLDLIAHSTQQTPHLCSKGRGSSSFASFMSVVAFPELSGYPKKTRKLLDLPAHQDVFTDLSRLASGSLA